MIKIAVLGYGFMGVSHVSNLLNIPNAEVVAVVDSDTKKFDTATTGNIDAGTQNVNLAGIKLFADFEKTLGEVDVDCVDICLPTHQHADFTIRAFDAGKHVICEKPMALTLEDCDRMIRAGSNCGKKLFVAQCIRFWPEYKVLKSYLDSDELGKPLSLLFRRVSGSPFWAGAQSWFNDPAKSGGAVFDLHVHDVDFIHYALGRPNAVYSQGITGQSGGNEGVMTQYDFGGDFMCWAEASWFYHTGFKMAYTAVFEGGTLVYDCTASPTLTLYRRDVEKPEPVTVTSGDGYSHELAYFVDCMENDSPPQKITTESARQSIEITLAEVRSMTEKSVIYL